MVWELQANVQECMTISEKIQLKRLGESFYTI